MKSKKQKRNRKRAEDFSNDYESPKEMVQDLAIALIRNSETWALLRPYIYTLNDENQVAFLKIVATIIVFNDKSLDEVACETLEDVAPFVFMYVKALKEIIYKEGK